MYGFKADYDSSMNTPDDNNLSSVCNESIDSPITDGKINSYTNGDETPRTPSLYKNESNTLRFFNSRSLPDETDYCLATRLPSECSDDDDDAHNVNVETPRNSPRKLPEGSPMWAKKAFSETGIVNAIEDELIQNLLLKAPIRSKSFRHNDPNDNGEHTPTKYSAPLTIDLAYRNGQIQCEEDNIEIDDKKRDSVLSENSSQFIGFNDEPGILDNVIGSTLSQNDIKSNLPSKSINTYISTMDHVSSTLQPTRLSSLMPQSNDLCVSRCSSRLEPPSVDYSTPEPKKLKSDSSSGFQKEINLKICQTPPSLRHDDYKSEVTSNLSLSMNESIKSTQLPLSSIEIGSRKSMQNYQNQNTENLDNVNINNDYQQQYVNSVNVKSQYGRISSTLSGDKSKKNNKSPKRLKPMDTDTLERIQSEINAAKTEMDVILNESKRWSDHNERVEAELENIRNLEHQKDQIYKEYTELSVQIKTELKDLNIDREEIYTSRQRIEELKESIRKMENELAQDRERLNNERKAKKGVEIALDKAQENYIKEQMQWKSERRQFVPVMTDCVGYAYYTNCSPSNDQFIQCTTPSPETIENSNVLWLPSGMVIAPNNKNS